MCRLGNNLDILRIFPIPFIKLCMFKITCQLNCLLPKHFVSSFFNPLNDNIMYVRHDLKSLGLLYFEKYPCLLIFCRGQSLLQNGMVY